MATDRLIGHDLARYHVEAILGRGGMGVVYRAIDTRLGRTVALKVLSDERSADPDFRERFLRESRLLASIDHPNIVPIYEADEADGQLYIAMRYVPGPELRLIIADEAPMDAAKTVAIIGQVADALDAAHVAGLVHRDVKPGNILVMPGATSALAGHAYLTDFGLTKSTGSDTGLTKIGQFVGTPGYVAPEQIEGKGVDHRVDIYALGCILYNCLSGDVPYPRDSTVASLWAHLKEPPPRLSEHRKGLPKGLDAVITKALAKSPDERYQTCGALAQAARTALEPARRKRVAAAGLAAGAATAAAGAGTGDAAEVGMGAATAETAIDMAPITADATVVGAVGTGDAIAEDQGGAAEGGEGVDAPPTVIDSSPAAPVVAAAVASTLVDPTIAEDPPEAEPDGTAEPDAEAEAEPDAAAEQDTPADAAEPTTTTAEPGAAEPDPADHDEAAAAIAAATVVESRDAMPVAAPATLLDSHADESPAPETIALAGAALADPGPTPGPDAPTQAAAVVAAPTAAVPPARPRAGSAFAGRERPLAAVLVAAVLLGVGLLGFNFVSGSGSGGASPSPNSSLAVAGSPDPGTYVALTGDTLASIAAKLGVTIDQLLDANPGLSGAIVTGQAILIPVGDPTSEPSVALPSSSTAPSAPASISVPSATPTAAPTPTPPPDKPDPTPTKKPEDRTAPTNPSVKVVDGNGTVFTTNVNLALKAGGATEMRIANVKSGKCDWGSGWQPYKTSITGWDLVGGNGGSRTVCAKFRDANHNESGDRGSIYYDRKPTAHAWKIKCYADAGDGSVTLKPMQYGDSDPDSGDSLHVSNASVTGNYASVAWSSTVITYSFKSGDHPPNWTDTVHYTITDEHGGSDSGTFAMDMSAFYSGCFYS